MLSLLVQRGVVAEPQHDRAWVRRAAEVVTAPEQSLDHSSGHHSLSRAGRRSQRHRRDPLACAP